MTMANPEFDHLPEDPLETLTDVQREAMREYVELVKKQAVEQALRMVLNACNDERTRTRGAEHRDAYRGRTDICIVVYRAWDKAFWEVNHAE